MTEADQKLWLDVLSYLKANHADICRQWFEDLEPVGTTGGVFHVRVEQPVRHKYLEKQCSDRFNDALQSVSGRLISVRFCEAEEAASLMSRRSDGSMRNGKHLNGFATSDHSGLVISPDNTFDNFIIGPESNLAYAAARAVADKPGRSYNPLFIHGGVGLGKTHLLQAICQALMTIDRSTTVLYTSCDGFMSDFLEAVQEGERSSFRHRFRDVDVLVIDDIHCLAKRDRVQEEFFHTFNALHQAGKQIVLSADSPPQDIPDLEARLVSRFQSGLVVEINPPGYDTRVQIVKRRAYIRGFALPEEVACFIASRPFSNVRELEGAVVRMQMQHATEKKAVTMEMARTALGPSDPTFQQEVTITSIIDAVVGYFGVRLSDLQSKRRQKSIAHPRQVCMYLARQHTRHSLEEIGGYFGGRDHTTVMHAVRTIERRKQEDGQLARALETLERQFRRER